MEAISNIVLDYFKHYGIQIVLSYHSEDTLLPNSKGILYFFLFLGMKYTITATKTGKSNYLLELNDSRKDVEFFQMSDNQLLVLLDGLTHTTYTQGYLYKVDRSGH